ncbi:N-6 DNA methylase [Picrophilus oshimae]|uniref:site-specific DNA-methyltransferase (adenine-specific) n=1 Tax=Picrophilus torridus (strain ATCC 700027 / DSM 9790 / JCM 10055 / NBRC 100828 / KAW 2/3) TaxID=1122961 RepID=A0A8G2L7U0_PICTO|nr:N-6 DNA methylase [Picrophilus oshimae]SMD30645.1 hypothetical protein SAMN02745355_0537 [Picrophilus oshimae DSM 9789]
MINQLEYIYPDNFENELKEYLKVLPTKNGELNKRAYMESKLMVNIMGIKPEFIGFEENRNDIYYAGILMETKDEINKDTREEALRELKRYKNAREKNGYTVSKLIITDGNIFEVYNSNEQKEYDFILNNEIKTQNDEYTLNNLYTKLYLLFNPKDIKLNPKVDIIIPRLLDLQNEILKNIQNKKIKIDNLEYTIKFDEWKNYVAKVLGNNKEISLEFYLRHVIIYYYSLFIVGKVLGENNIENILNGSAFESKGIMNFVEPDNFFDIFIDKNNKFFSYINEEIDLYDFSNIKDDIFRVLYESVISPSERHNLGEFYTPEWLAKILVDELVTKDNVILDPACGSGTFLKLSIERKKDLGSQKISDEVIGFDINPLAVVFSKANYILSLGKNYIHQKLNLIIPVFLADSLMTYYKRSSLNADVQSVTIDFNPIANIKADFDYSYVNAGDEPIIQLNKYIEDMKDFVYKNLNTKNINVPDKFKYNSDLIKKLIQLVKNKKDGIWFYVLKNIYTPYYFRNKIDVVLGNPPWLTYRETSYERQHDLDSIYDDYKMKHGSQNKANVDYAGFFIARSSEYLKRKNKKIIGKIGFVITRSIMNASQYHGLRTKAWINSANISEIIDIDNSINPFRKPSCIVVFDFNLKDKKEISGYLIKNSTNEKVDVFNNNINYDIINKKYYINTSENESAISDKPMNFTKNSIYKSIFKRGATIFPRPYFFVDILKEEQYAYLIKTMDKYNPLTADKRHKKGDYSFIWNNFYALKDLIYNIVLGESIENFGIHLNEKAILPLIDYTLIIDQNKDTIPYTYSIKNNIYETKNMNTIQNNLLKNYLEKLNEIEKDWENNRGNKFTNNKNSANSMSFIDWLNYGNKLLSQHSYNYMVVYNTSGTKIRSAVVENKDIIVDVTSYYAYFDDKNEAYYICGILNSNYLIKQLKNSGILSERHIHKKPFQIDIPKYDKNSNIHNKVAELSIELHQLKEKINNESNKDEINKLKKEFNDKYNELNDYVKECFNN